MQIPANLLSELTLEHPADPDIAALCERLATVAEEHEGERAAVASHLALLLYVRGNAAAAERIAALADPMVFNHNYNVWTFIHRLRTLKARIAREAGRLGEAEDIRKRIEEDQTAPDDLMDEAGRRKLMERIRARTTYESLLDRDDIELAEDEEEATALRLTALHKMIGCRESAGYPHIDKAKLECEIEAYMSALNGKA